MFFLFFLSIQVILEYLLGRPPKKMHTNFQLDGLYRCGVIIIFCSCRTSYWQNFMKLGPQNVLFFLVCQVLLSLDTGSAAIGQLVKMGIS